MNAQNRAGESALHEAARRGRADIARMLLSQGAAPELRNGRGIMAMGLASAARHDEVIAALRQAASRTDLNVHSP